MTETTWYSATAAAHYLGVERTTVYRLVAECRIEHHRIGSGKGRIAFKREHLDAYLASCRVKVGEPPKASAAVRLKHLRLPPRGA